MSGIFTKQKYDNCYTDEFYVQEVNPGRYRIDKNFAESEYKCSSTFGPRQNSRNANSETPAGNLHERKDIENYLLNLDIPDSRCMNLNTLLEKNQRLYNLTKNKKCEVESCEKILDFNYTRLDEPVLNLRSVYINRFGYPIVDPMSTLYYGMEGTEQCGNSRFGVNTQLAAKDSL